MTALAQLDDLQRHLHTLRTDPLALPALARCAQDAQTLRQALPPRYDTVLKDLLNRLESSALFSEESCSFSQRDLLDSLQLWLDKARAQLTQV